MPRLVPLGTLVLCLACAPRTAPETSGWAKPAHSTSSQPTGPLPDVGPTRAVNDRDYLPAALAAIGAATERVRVAEFLLYRDWPVSQLIDALEDAASRGVRVQVLADETGEQTQTVLDGLGAWGVEGRLDSRDVTLHAKLIVADDVVLLGSHNFTDAALDDNHEASILVADAQVAGWYGSWFDALWEAPDALPALDPLDRTDFAAVSDRQITPVLVDCIEQATDRVDVVVYAVAWNDAYPGSEVDQVLTALEEAHDRGVQVTPMFDASSWIESNGVNDAAVSRLQSAGIDVLRTPAHPTTHAKLTRCDDRVIVSDANWSYSGLWLMRGVSMVVADPTLVDQYDAWIESIRLESQ